MGEECENGVYIQMIHAYLEQHSLNKYVWMGLQNCDVTKTKIKVANIFYCVNEEVRKSVSPVH